MTKQIASTALGVAGAGRRWVAPARDALPPVGSRASSSRRTLPGLRRPDVDRHTINPSSADVGLLLTRPRQSLEGPSCLRRPLQGSSGLARPPPACADSRSWIVSRAIRTTIAMCNDDHRTRSRETHACVHQRCWRPGRIRAQPSWTPSSTRSSCRQNELDPSRADPSGLGSELDPPQTPAGAATGGVQLVT